MEDKLKKIYEVIGQIIVEEIQNYLVTKKQLLRKGGMVDKFGYKISRNKNLEILGPEYYEYYVQGRKRFAKKVPIFALIKWIRRYRFKVGRGRDKKGRFISDNQYAFAIQTAIYKNGIKKKEDFVASVLKNNESVIEQIIDEEFEKILDKEIEKVFE